MNKRRWQARALTAGLLLPAALLIVKPARLAAWIGRRRPCADVDNAPSDADLAEWTDRVLRALRTPWRRNCMRRSMVLYYLIRRAGRSVALNLGVRRDAAGVLDAHAWLTRDGAPLLEPPANQPTAYRIVVSFLAP